MAPLSPSAFRSLLGTLDRDSFERFVGALWRARGYEVEHDGCVLVATARGEHRIWVHHPGRWALSGGKSPPATADTVVTSAGDAPDFSGREVIGVGDLYAMAFYGIDRTACTEIFEEVFGRPPADLEPENTISRAELVTAVVVLVAVVAGVAVHTTTPGGEATATDLDGRVDASPAEDRFNGPPGNAGASTTTARAAAPPESATTDSAGNSSLASGDVDLSTLIVGSILNTTPGLGVGGVTDASVLATTHADLIAERSYRIEITYREFDNGTRRGTARETAHVSPDGTDRSVEYDSYFNESPEILVGSPGPGIETGDVTAEGYAERSRQFIQDYLAVEESWIMGSHQIDGTYRFTVGLRGSPSAALTNLTGRAVVDEHGLVHGIRSAYGVPEAGVRVVVTIEYSRIEGTEDGRTAGAG